MSKLSSKFYQAPTDQQGKAIQVSPPHIYFYTNLFINQFNKNFNIYFSKFAVCFLFVSSLMFAKMKNNKQNSKRLANSLLQPAIFEPESKACRHSTRSWVAWPGVLPHAISTLTSICCSRRVQPLVKRLRLSNALCPFCREWNVRIASSRIRSRVSISFTSILLFK